MKANRKLGVGDYDFWHTETRFSLAQYADTRWVNFIWIKSGGDWELSPGSKIIGDSDET